MAGPYEDRLGRIHNQDGSLMDVKAKCSECGRPCDLLKSAISYGMSYKETSAVSSITGRKVVLAIGEHQVSVTKIVGPCCLDPARQPP